MIQLGFTLGCKQSHNGNKSVRVARGVKGAGTGNLQTKGFSQDTKGKLEEGSFTTDPTNGTNVNLAGQDCSMSKMLDTQSAYIKVALGNDKAIYLPTSKDVIENNFTKIKPLSSKSTLETLDKTHGDSVYTEIASDGLTDGRNGTFTVNRTVIEFKDKKGKDITKDEIENARQTIPTNSDLTNIILFTDKTEFTVKDGKYTTIMYTRQLYKNGSGPTDFVIKNGEEIKGDFDTSETHFECTIGKK